MSGYDPNDPVQFGYVSFALMSKLDDYFITLVDQGVDHQTAYQRIRASTGNHPWFPTDYALTATRSPPLRRIDVGCDARGRSSPHGVAFTDLHVPPQPMSNQASPHGSVAGAGVSPSPITHQQPVSNCAQSRHSGMKKAINFNQGHVDPSLLNAIPVVTLSARRGKHALARQIESIERLK